MQQTPLFFSQLPSPPPPPPELPPSPPNAPLLKPRQRATSTTCLIPLTDKQIVKQKKKSPASVVEERTLTRLYPTESLSESRSDSVLCLKLVVVIFLFFKGAASTYSRAKTYRGLGSSDSGGGRSRLDVLSQGVYSALLNTLNKTLVTAQYLYTWGHVWREPLTFQD